MIQHMTKPQTIGIALSDSPWDLRRGIGEVSSLGRYARQHRSRFNKDDLITNLLLYLATDTVTSSIWLYHGAVLEMTSGAQAAPAVRCPTRALYSRRIRAMAAAQTIERFYNVQRWTEDARAGICRPGGARPADRGFAAVLRGFRRLRG